MHWETAGLVIGSKAVGEQDVLLTLLTQEQGVITAYAPGVRRKKSRLYTACQLLTYGTYMLFDYRGRRTVDSALVERMFTHVHQDLRKLALCSYFAQIVSGCGVAEPSTQAQLRLFLTCLHLLDRDKRGCLQVKPVFVLRLLTLLGYMPDLTQCVQCGRADHEQMAFDPFAGDLLCGDCREENARIPLSAPMLSAMRQMVYGPLESAFQPVLSPEEWMKLNLLTDAYATGQLEQEFPALAYFKAL